MIQKIFQVQTELISPQRGGFIDKMRLVELFHEMMFFSILDFLFCKKFMKSIVQRSSRSPCNHSTCLPIDSTYRQRNKKNTFLMTFVRSLSG